MSVKRNPRLPGLEQAIREHRNALRGAQVLVGLTGKHGATGEASAAELVQIARAQEFGTATIPPRPFLRTALKRHRRVWSNGLEDGVRAATKSGRPGVLIVLRRVAVTMVGDVQATLRKGPWQPNAPSTVARKGSDQPLIDTGQLVQSIRALVRTPRTADLVVG